MDVSLIINIVVIALLAATIFYAFRLERRLASVRDTQAALGDVIRELNSAAVRAEAGIQGLKSAAMSSGQALDDKIKRARSMADELAILVQAGDRLGQRIEASRPQANNTQRAPSRAIESLRALGGVR